MFRDFVWYLQRSKFVCYVNANYYYKREHSVKFDTRRNPSRNAK